jgi:hypothetical protein
VPGCESMSAATESIVHSACSVANLTRKYLLGSEDNNLGGRRTLSFYHLA